MRRSTDQGETWEDLVELFPPLDHVDPATKAGVSGGRPEFWLKA